ncbi:MAG: flagellar biosynthesis anti-sigma factor FlgM [Gammaproteobacteria bacterium]|nr:flagellar biosynthesis anti-sigma factor FlgM [Gammaproteobacteria bacterium]MCP4983747.1 flagellar biosynthesis anti-sigma factor FlgM [Gammaproteobacteria bacterium]
MTDAINTQNRPRNSVASTDAKTGSVAKANQQGTRGKPASTTNDEASTVKLSSTALVEELSEQIRNLPEVNEARVEAVKRALGEGEYQPDAEVIARKYSEIEKLLP